MRLAMPPADLLHRLGRLPPPVIEIGAGDGMWLAVMRHDGIDCRGVDKAPQHTSVDKGDHVDAAQDGATMLAVWPPNWTDLDEWVGAAKWGAVAVVGDFDRFQLSQEAMSGFDLIATKVCRGGRKGGSTAKVWIRTAGGADARDRSDDR
jgi:hypothetical protein